MKRIILSLGVIAIVAIVAVGATRAYFSDTETSMGNTFAAAGLNLEIGASSTMPFIVSNVVPGQSGTGTLTLTNTTGGISGLLDVSLVNVIDNENDMIEPETQSVMGIDGHMTTGDYDGNGGELDMFLQFAMFIDVNKDGVFNAGDYQLAYNGQKAAYPGFWGGDIRYSGLNSMLPPWTDIMTMNAGDSVNLVVMWQFPTESTDGNYSQNMAMTDSLGFDTLLSLEQVH